MSETTTSQWNTILDELGLQLESTDAPDGQTGQWSAILSRFSRHSFARLLLGTDSPAIPLRLEIALGPPPSDTTPLVDLLKACLQERSETSWSVLSSEIPWIFESPLSEHESPEAALAKAAALALRICEQFEAIDKPGAWSKFLAELIDADPPHQDRDEPSDATPRSAPAGPFEPIGTASPEDREDKEATITASAVARVQDALHLAVGFPQVLAPDRADALVEGLQHHLHAKYDARARLIEPDDRPELRLPASCRTTLYLAVDPPDEGPGLSTLRRELTGFLERLEKFSSFGVDLFEYLGVGDIVLQPHHEEPRRPDAESPAASPLPSRRRAPYRTSQAAADDEVVFDLSGGTRGSSSTLRAQDFTDPRLQREDATTALVDVVLRHPGYSDRRIGQVLSILLSIDYHDATTIADAAPCVIAWALGRQRALSFQDVIESAGGKVLLVEPGTFGER